MDKFSGMIEQEQRKQTMKEIFSVLSSSVPRAC